MKVRFYSDVPTVASPQGYSMMATTTPGAFCMGPGWKRVAFDVDFPPDVLREFDSRAPALYAGVIEEGGSGNVPAQ